MIIVGAGITGLLAGILNPNSIIYESNADKESNHKAVFRCKSEKISKLLGIPFKKVVVRKAIWLDGKEVNPTPRIAHMYSHKVTGIVTARSIFNIQSGIRFIPPNNFIEQLKMRCNIQYNFNFDFNKVNGSTPIISTIPMNIIVQNFNIQTPNFVYCPVFVNRFHLQNCDTNCTIYYPSTDLSVYRASIVGDILITEGRKELNSQTDLDIICESLGIKSIAAYEKENVNFKQKYGKITKLETQVRKKIILNLTLKHNIYSLGRFATWRPTVMFDDILNDIYVIKQLILEGKYEALKYK